MSSLKTIRAGGTVANDSKGNGTVMRCAPIAAWAIKHEIPWEIAYQVAKEDALLTHKHPYAWQSSVQLIAIYKYLFMGLPFREAVKAACSELRDTGTIDQYIQTLILTALDGEEFKTMKVKLGGWVAEEALALAVGAVAHSEDYLGAVKNAVMIGGDSDTVGSVAGSLASFSGMEVPQYLKDRINAREAIEYVLDKL
jgi:ADP-ribosylglycohydrolase